MFTIELSLKGNPIPVSVERKDKESAHATYQSILAALNGGEPKVLELTCEKQPEKTIALVTENICAVQIAEKSASTAAIGVGFGRY